MKEIYNYTKVWKSPYKFYHFKTLEIRVRNGIKLSTVVLTTIIYIIFYMLNNKLNLTNYLGIIYWLIPLGIIFYITKINVDDKNFIIFIYDYIVWYYFAKIKKVTYAYDKKVLYKKENIKFK